MRFFFPIRLFCLAFLLNSCSWNFFGYIRNSSAKTAIIDVFLLDKTQMLTLPNKVTVANRLVNFKAGFRKYFYSSQNAVYKQVHDPIHDNVLDMFTHDWSKMKLVKLHLKGSPFQLKVWEALLKIPSRHLTSYSYIARHVNNENAHRAVGSAVGNNPVAFLIPCHRVIQSTGVLGQYHWGTARKMAMIGWEAARADMVEENE